MPSRQGAYAAAATGSSFTPRHVDGGVGALPGSEFPLGNRGTGGQVADAALAQHRESVEGKSEREEHKLGWDEPRHRDGGGDTGSARVLKEGVGKEEAEGLSVQRLLERLLLEQRRDREVREEEKRTAARELAEEKDQRRSVEAALREQLADRDKQILRLSGLVASLKTELALSRGGQAQIDSETHGLSEELPLGSNGHGEKSNDQAYDV